MLYTRAMGRMGLTESKQIAYKSNKIHRSQNGIALTRWLLAIRSGSY